MFKKRITNNKVTLKKYKAAFVTIDNVRHEGCKYNWVITDRLCCRVPEYLMIDIKSDGYIEDETGIMYMLPNVISIEWALIDKITVDDTFNRYQVYVSELNTN